MVGSMKETRDESVEELAEELESRLVRKEGSDELEEIELEDIQKEWLSEDEDPDIFFEEDFLEDESYEGRSGHRVPKDELYEDRPGEKAPKKASYEGRSGKKAPKKESHKNRLGTEASVKESRRNRFDERNSDEGFRESRRGKDIPEEEFMEDDWEEDDIAPMKPWVMAVAMAGIVLLAAIICAVLWHFTHLEKEDGDKTPQMSASVSGENSAANIEESGEPSGAVPENEPSPVTTPDSEVTAASEPELNTSTESSAPAGSSVPAASSVPVGSSVPAASSAPVGSSAPAASSAVPSMTVQPGAQASDTVQEPVSGTTAMEFIQSSEEVTPKDVVNLRSEPSTLNADNIVAQAKNGEILNRTGVNEDTGWTRLEYNGETLYAVTQYLTTDLTYKTPVQTANPNRVNTKDGRIILFTDCSDNITPKEYVNLRTEPSTSEGESTVRCQISNGEVVHRTGYSPDAGWSRVEYNGEILYVVSSYVYTVE